MTAIQLYYDEIISLKNFLHALEYQYFSHSLNANQWIETIYCHLENETLEWVKNNEQMIRIYFNARHDFAIARMMKHLYQLLENRFAISLSSRVDKALQKIKQKRQKFIENYYTRVNTLFEHVEDQNKSIDVDKCLDYEHDFCLLKAVDYFVDKLKNNRLRRKIVKTFQEVSNEDNAAIVNLESINNAVQWNYTTMKATRKFRNRLYTDDDIVIDMSQSNLKKTTCDLSKINTSIYSFAHISKSWFTQNERVQTSFEIIIVYEFQSILKKTSCSLSKINATIVNSSDIESMNEIFAFESDKWFASITTLFEIIVVYESSLVLKKMSCNLSEISTATENSSDIESIDEILVFEFRKWTIVFVAKKKIFDFTIILHATSKNQLASHIEKNIDAIVLNKSSVESTVDVKTLNQKIFVLIVIYDAVSKNSFASYFENIENSIIVNIRSHEHFISENDFATQIFDSDIEIDAFSKNSLIQHIENSKTLKKNSIYIYELFAFSVFDFNIDIDFDIYTIDTSIIQSSITSSRRKMQLSSFRDFALRNISFDWNRSNIDSIGRRTFSIFICITVSDVFSIISNVIFIEIADIEFCEKKQSFCFIDCSVSLFIDCVVSEHSDFYEKKQFCFFVDVDDTVDIVVTRTDALILIVGMIKKKKDSAWMSFLGLILLMIWIWIEYLAPKSKHKGLSKVKIKTLSESEHIESGSQSIVAGIPVKSAYKIALFSGIRQRLEFLR